MINQEQLPMVAVASMNDTHLEEMILVNQLEASALNNDLEAITNGLMELLAHTQAHFEGEEELMKAHHFPAYEMHKEEHDRHLHELFSVINYFNQHQQCSAVTAYINGTLSPWLIHHIETMDTVTAQYLKDQGL